MDLFFHQDIFSYMFHIPSWNIIQALIPTGPNWSPFKPPLLIINCSEPQSKVHNCLSGDSLSLKLLSPYHPRWSQLTDIYRFCIKSLQGFGQIGMSFLLLSLWELLKGFGLTLCTILWIHTHTHTHTHTCCLSYLNDIERDWSAVKNSNPNNLLVRKKKKILIIQSENTNSVQSYWI